jgi:hypothetical protein
MSGGPRGLALPKVRSQHPQRRNESDCPVGPERFERLFSLLRSSANHVSRACHRESARPLGGDQRLIDADRRLPVCRATFASAIPARLGLFGCTRRRAGALPTPRRASHVRRSRSWGGMPIRRCCSESRRPTPKPRGLRVWSVGGAAFSISPPIGAAGDPQRVHGVLNVACARLLFMPLRHELSRGAAHRGRDRRRPADGSRSGGPTLRRQLGCTRYPSCPTGPPLPSRHRT